MNRLHFGTPYHRFIGVALFCLTLSFSLHASPAAIKLEVSSQQVLPQSVAVARVAVGDPAIADIRVVSPKSLMLTAKKAGKTTLHIWKQGTAQPEAFAIHVTPSEAPASLSQPAAIDSMQVQADIKVAEISRNTLRELGLNLAHTAGNGSTYSLSSPGGASTAFSDAFNLVFSLPTSRISGALSMLEGQGLAHVLAEPSLVALSGQTASFLAGGEIPIPVPQGGTGNGNVTIEYKQFGIRLTLTPTVLSNQSIALKVAPEVSQLDYSNAVTVGSVQVPALSVRRTETTVMLGDGESFVISGLVSQSTLANVDKVPGLGALPIIGAFFRSTRFHQEQKELVMMVTPHLVKPIRAGGEVGALPGARYQGKSPDSVHTFLMESGDFNAAPTGWSP